VDGDEYNEDQDDNQEQDEEQDNNQEQDNNEDQDDNEEQDDNEVSPPPTRAEKKGHGQGRDREVKKGPPRRYSTVPTSS